MKKVTARHLMIGVWVLQRGKYRQVEALRRFRNNDKIMLDCYGCSTATPIPITEEWLKGNGWTNSNNSFNKLVKTLFMCIDIQDSLMIRCDNKVSFFRGIQYIHQLQQAYRLATGKELKVKF